MFTNDISSYLSKANSIAVVDIEPSLSYLEKALENTEVRVGIFGSRYVISKTNSGCVSLYQITKVANKVFNEIRKTWNFKKSTRQRLKILEQKIDLFFDKSDKLVKNKNLFTLFFSCLKEYSLFPYTTRFYWEEGTRLSSHYTKKQWKETFWFWDRLPKEPAVIASYQPDVYYHV